ncbi:MAG TPA: ornithine carbamoyltransferase [Thermoanaerobaculia bacterium]|nr:ornithine carbamoyltransferase [Thermoanaerobaculia bacterium]
MAIDLRQRSLLTLEDFTRAEIQHLLDLSAELKCERRAGRELRRLVGRAIALIFEKTSTRTRCAFELAAFQQGAHATLLGPSGTQIGHKESLEDTARFLGRLYDGIEYRGFAQASLQVFAEHAGVPVWNGLTDDYHPTQVLADLLTMGEHAGAPLSGLSLCYLGDARFNMGNSLAVGGTKMGMDMRIAAPRSYWPKPELVERCRGYAQESGGSLHLSESVAEAVAGVDYLVTDVWVSMGEPEEVWAERIEALHPYQINRETLRLSGRDDVKVLHCLPAFHDRETAVGEAIYQRFGLDAMEVTDEVFESEACIAFDAAENRLHTAKAVLVATLGGEP